MAKKGGAGGAGGGRGDNPRAGRRGVGPKGAASDVRAGETRAKAAAKSTTTIRGFVSVSNLGQKNLRKHTSRNAKGQFVGDKNAQMLTVDVWRWPSAMAYRQRSLEGQLTALLSTIQSWSRHVRANQASVVHTALYPTFQKSRRYCPISPDGSRPYFTPGTLRSSGKLVVKQASDGAKATIGYGGNGIPFYAVYVHEIPKRHAPPTRYKFLESAIREDMADIKDRLFYGAKALMGGK